MAAQRWLAVCVVYERLDRLGAQMLNPAGISGNDWKIAGVGDFNGDGKPDLVWQHKDGWLALWYMDGPNRSVRCT